MDLNELIQSAEIVIDESELNLLSTNSVLNKEGKIKT